MAVLGMITILVLISLTALGGCEDRPCNARDVRIEGRSVVCVCNSTYCDTVTREVPEPGTYVVYTSSDAGQRFEKTRGVIEIDQDDTIEDGDSEEDIDPDFIPEDSEEDNDPESEPDDIDPESVPEDRFEDTSNLPNESEEQEGSALGDVFLRIFVNMRHQFIEGFGGSVTDAASINWRKLSDGAQTHLINSYFGPEGLEYNLIRVPIGGSDFSTHPYTYNEEPWYDAALSNFSLSEEDLFYKLPMIRRSKMVATDEIKITASTWSPPIWMKTNERITGFGQLKPEYYQSYADYHIRFMEEYAKADVKIWAITTTNEPLNGIIPVVTFNSLGWTPAQLGRWVANNLGPTIRNSRFNETLILAVDDQRYILPVWLRGMAREDPKSIDYIDGIAIHYYGNFVSPSILSRLHDIYPNKILLSTEACEGPMPWDLEKVELGSWTRAHKYTTSIMQDLNNFVVGWIDWNLCLDPDGGPNWADNFVDAPILVYGDKDEFIKQPMFYAMGHFSKFIPRGSRRIRVTRRSLATVENVAVLTPSGNIVMVFQNRRTQELNVRLRISNSRYIQIKMEPRSIKTLELNPN